MDQIKGFFYNIINVFALISIVAIIGVAVISTIALSPESYESTQKQPEVLGTSDLVSNLTPLPKPAVLLDPLTVISLNSQIASVYKSEKDFIIQIEPGNGSQGEIQITNNTNSIQNINLTLLTSILNAKGIVISGIEADNLPTILNSQNKEVLITFESNQSKVVKFNSNGNSEILLKLNY